MVGDEVVFTATPTAGARRISGWLIYYGNDTVPVSNPNPVEELRLIVPEEGFNVVVIFTETRLESSLIIGTNEEPAFAGRATSVDVSLENNPGFASMALRINVPLGLILTSYTVETPFAAALTGPAGTLPDTEIPGGLVGAVPMFLNWHGAQNITANGKVLTLNFRVADNAEEGIYPITASFSSFQGWDNPPTDHNGRPILDMRIVDGHVEVSEGLPPLLGDVSGDGVVNFYDAALVARFLVGHNPATFENATNFNISRGMVTPGSVAAGHVRLVDATMIARHVVHGITLGRYPVPI
jgi:hypothetical protein